MKTSQSAVLVAGTVLLLTVTSPSRADDGLGLILDLTTDYLLRDYAEDFVRADHRPRRRDRDYHYGNDRDYRLEFGRSQRRGFGFNSYTSQPLRGGSSRRTRIIENPYSNRIVTGITLTGIDDDIVHIKDVVSYPGQYYLSPLGYTLSAYHPARYINTGHYIDYISVAAKRREYFSVTFHYD